MGLKRLDAWPERLVLAAVLVIAALISYTHLREVWIAAHSPWPDLGPLTVDGLFAAAWLRIRRRRREGLEAGWLAWVALSTALVATVAGNITAAVVSWTSLAVVLTVAAWPALAFTLVWELVTGHAATPSKLPPPAHQSPPVQVEAPTHGGGELQVSGVETVEGRVESWEAKRDRLLLARAGRKRLMAELDITEHAARKLLADRSTEVETDGEELA